LISGLEALPDCSASASFVLADSSERRASATNNNGRFQFDEIARAAIEAIREPTEEMVNAGCHHELLGDMAGRYMAMIDAALQESEGKQG